MPRIRKEQKNHRQGPSKTAASASAPKVPPCRCKPYEYVDQYGSPRVGCVVWEHEPNERCRALAIYAEELLALCPDETHSREKRRRVRRKGWRTP
jgi:hypothetical protein